MFYLTGDGRLCAYVMIIQDGKVAIGVPRTDVEDVRRLAHFDRIVGFDDEVGMIHSISDNFEYFGIKEGIVGLEYTYLTQSMMGMFTHPHAKPEGIIAKDCTHILSELIMPFHIIMNLLAYFPSNSVCLLNGYSLLNYNMHISMNHFIPNILCP